MQLKPCPFCGGDACLAIVKENAGKRNTPGHSGYVVCRNCRARSDGGWFNSSCFTRNRAAQEIADGWNKRAEVAKPDPRANLRPIEIDEYRTGYFHEWTSGIDRAARAIFELENGQVRVTFASSIRFLDVGNEQEDANDAS